MQKSAHPDGAPDPTAQPEAPYKVSHLTTGIAAFMLVLFAGLAILYPRTPQYTNIQIEVPGRITFTMLIDGQATAGHCGSVVDAMASTILSACPQCRAIKRECVNRLSPEQREMLSEAPLENYSVRLPTGVTVYASQDPELARMSCEESERLSASGQVPIKCHVPGTARPTAEPSVNGFRGINALAGASLFLAALFASWFVCWMIVRFQHLHGHFSNDQIDGGPQKFHAVPTPRVGGVAVMAGLMAAGALIMIMQPWYRVNAGDFGLLIIAGMPAFLGGLSEDVTKRVGVLDRLLLTMASGALAAWLLGAILDRVDVPGLDEALVWLPFAIIFTAFAVGGIANAINIIDGYNGIAAGYAAIVLGSFAWVSAGTGDVLLFKTCLTLIGALLGFLVWNWPKGRIFLGDGGAYLLGFLMAEISVLLVMRNPAVSPWYPLLALIYPIIETLFSIYRKLVLRGTSPGRPDGLHFHMLIYKRLVRCSVGSKDLASILKRNSKVAPYLWFLSLVPATVGALLNDDSVLLAIGAVLFVVYYVWLYRRIAKWRSPRWMIQQR